MGGVSAPASVHVDRKLGDAAQEEGGQVPDRGRVDDLQPVDSLGELAQYGRRLHAGEHVAEAAVDALAEAQVLPDVGAVWVEVVWRLEDGLVPVRGDEGEEYDRSFRERRPAQRRRCGDLERGVLIGVLFGCGTGHGP